MESNSKDVLTLKRNSILMGLCKKYKEKWDLCSNKKQLVDMSLDINGVEFMADSIAFGWGLSKEYLQEEFGEFMNGNYQSEENGYTSEMFIGASGITRVKSTLLLVAYCDDLEIEIPEYMACRIYVCGGSRVQIRNRGHVEIYEYGQGNTIAMIEYDGSNSLRKAISSSRWISGRHGAR